MASAPAEFRPYIENLEELAANAWPAPVVQHVDGWRLRYGWGITRRANSVLTTGGGTRVPLTDKIDIAEGFYRRRRLPARFALSEATTPEVLDGLLHDRGYVLDGRISAEIAAVDDVVVEAGRPDAALEVEVEEAFTDEWAEAWWRLTGDGADPNGLAVGKVILESTGPPSAHVSVRGEGGIVAVGRVTVERGWGSITGVATAPELRRRGVSRTVVGHLARWAHDARATALVAHVDADDPAAVGLVRAVGFQRAYQCWYRRGPEPA